MAAEPASAPSPSRESLAALRVAAAIGLLAGFGEGIGLLAAQASRRTQWPITNSCGREILWVAPLLDALLFVAVAGLILPLLRWVRSRARVVPVAAASLALLAYDWSRITHEWSRLVAAGVAGAVGLLAWFALRRAAAPLARASRFALPLLLVAWLATLVVVERQGRGRSGATVAPPAGARDVVVVVLDTVRADHLSAYGYARATSPWLETLAAEGARFDACFSTSSWTLPAHASLLTGRLPYEHGALLGPLDASLPLLPETFVEHGWKSGAFSANLCFFHTGFGFGRGFDRFGDFGWSWPARVGATLFGREVLQQAGPRVRNHVLRKTADAVVDDCLAWIDEEPERPFFAVLNFFDAHDPYEPPPATRDRFAGDGIAPAPMPPKAAGEDRPWDDALLALEARRYDECILAIDRELERLAAELAARGRLDNAVIVVTSDHGESFGERGARLHRGSLQRDTTHVPLIVRAPGLVAPDTVVATPVSLLAVPTTLLDLLGLQKGAYPDASLAPWLSGDESVPDEEPLVVGEIARHPWPEYRRRPCFDGSLRSLVRGRWHYVVHETRGALLFDWIADPREEQDLLADHPDVAAAFETALREAFAGLSAHPNAVDARDLSAHPELAGLGYAGGG
ncbi:MAG: sulfatase [Planctomycetes bacterium]|nr:sulfatase [Planctomycetota bacterium]